MYTCTTIETKYNAEGELAHDRKAKEKKIEKFNEALKSKKKKSVSALLVVGGKS